MEEVIIGNARLICGDCMDVLPTLEKVDAVITDPPYGIDYDPAKNKRYDGSNSEFSKISGDFEPMDLSVIFSIKAKKIIWGAENFYTQLPHRGRWACWHKRSEKMQPNSMRGSDFELAWMDESSGYYKFFNLIHGGVINADSERGNNAERLHPTQKPINLMKWCIEQLGSPNLIIDPFMGSGTTGVAAIQLGRSFIGIERERKYFDIACKRIEQAVAQGQLFAPEPIKQIQESFL